LKKAETTHRMTQQRKVILEEVKRLGTHPTADEVYEAVRKRLPKVSLGTVYRNLDLLSKEGYIRKIDPAYPQMRFDANTDDHYHVVCMACGRVDDVSVEPPKGDIDHMEKRIIQISKYTILGHNLEFLGLCPECRKSKGDSLQQKIMELDGGIY